MLECFGPITLVFCLSPTIATGYASLLLLDGSKGLLTREGITQCDLFSMMLYFLLLYFLSSILSKLQKKGLRISKPMTLPACVADLPSLQT